MTLQQRDEDRSVPARPGGTGDAHTGAPASLKSPPVEDGALDEATLRRVMNGLQARGVFDTTQAQPVASASPGSRSQRCWYAALGCLRARWAVHATPATLAAAVLAASWLMAQPPVFEADTAQRVADLPTRMALTRVGLADATVIQFVPTAHPQQDALTLVSMLAAQGVTAELHPMTQDRVVKAQLPVGQVPALVHALGQQGLAAPPVGPLVVRFVARAG